MKDNYKKWIKNLLMVIILIVSIYFLVEKLVSNWNEVQAYDWEISYFYFLISLVGLIIYYLVAHAFQWRPILSTLGVKLTFYKSLKYWTIGQLGRYLPGKVWFVLGRLYFCSKEGIRKSIVLLSIFLELFFLAITSIFIFLVSLLFAKQVQLNTNYIYALIVIIFLAFIFIHPKVFSKIINFILKKIKKPLLKIEITKFQILKFSLLISFLWFFQGFLFFIFSKSIYSQLGWSFLPLFIGAYALAWFLGLISFVTPGGIGVREVILTYFLGNYLPSYIIVVIVILFRLILTAIEFGLGAILSMHHKFGKKNC